MDIFLLVVTLVIFILLIVVGVYLLVHFSHPDDKSDAYFPKLVVVLGFVIAGSVVLLLPLDVANNDGYAGCDGYDTRLCGGLNMQLFWNILYILVLVWLVLLIPFSTFYYEADDGTLMSGTAIGAKQKKNSRFCEAIKYQFVVIIAVALVFFIAYFFLRQTNIPVTEYVAPSLSSAPVYTTSRIILNTTVQPFSRNQLADVTMQDTIVADATFATKMNISINVDPITFCIAMMSFIGWFFFSIFGGIGMAALPLDLILTFKNRPRHMDAVEMADTQNGIRERVNELVDIGEMIKIEEEELNADAETVGAKGFLGMFKSKAGYKKLTRKERKERKQTLKEFKQAVYILEKDIEDFKACTTSYNEYNPLIPFASLFFGLLSIIISIFWVLQIVLYVLPLKFAHPLLNSYFRWFDNWFPMFGVLSVAIFSFYLLTCALKGCFKFGLRFLFFAFHPMEPNKTYMSSFLFNIALLLLCSIPVVQFSTEAFAEYARNTTSLQVFGTQIRYMRFFSYFFVNNVFIYAFLLMFLLTCLYLMCKPVNKGMDGQTLKQKLSSRRS